MYIDGRLEASGDGLRKLKVFSPANVNVNGNGRISWAGGCDPTTACQSTALHASLLSLAMSDGELSDNDALSSTQMPTRRRK